MTKTQAALRYGIYIAIALCLSLFLSIITTHQSAKAGAPVCTWTDAGVNTNWSTAGNWSCDAGTVPTDGTQLVFPYDVATTDPTISNNDLSAALVYAGIEFSGTCNAINQYQYYSYNLTGNTIRVAGDVIANISDHVGAEMYQCRPRISAALTANSDMMIDRLSVEGTFTTGGHAITLMDGFLSVISGAGSIAVTNSGFEANSPAYTGTTTIIGGSLLVYATGALGASSAPLIIGTGGQLQYATAVTIANNITVEAGATVPSIISAPQSGETLQIPAYAKNCSSNGDCGSLGSGMTTLSGTLTLNTDLVIRTGGGGVTVSGPIVGNSHGVLLHNPTAVNNAGLGNLIINSSSNASTSANGTYAPVQALTTLGDSIATDIYIGIGNRVIINGQRSNIIISNGGILSGSGTVGNIQSYGGRIAIGNSPGQMSTGSINYDNATNVDVEIGGTALGDYDRMNVTGTVSLGNSILTTTHFNSYIPVQGDVFTIINNDGSDAITGTFNGLAQGATFTVDTVTYTISYTGGTGNDVTITATTSPGPPNTAGILALPTNLLLPAGAIIVALGVLMLRRAVITSRRRSLGAK